MKKKIIILSIMMIFITSITNTINHKISYGEKSNKIFINDNIKPKTQNNLNLTIEDFITVDDADFRNCRVEFWFVLFRSVKKKLGISYSAWINYFKPMMEKLNEYIVTSTIATRSAGQIKIALLNMFSEVIKVKFSKGGNDTDRYYPYWDGYQIAASYILRNKDYLDTFFKNKGSGSIFETYYWDENCFLDEEQMEALDVSSEADAFIWQIEKFTLPSGFPVLKADTWDIFQNFFNDKKTSISLSDLTNHPIIEFKFGGVTLKYLKKSLDKYSSINKVHQYAGYIALSFCTMLKDKISQIFKIDEKIALQLSTYLYYYRNEINSWSAIKFVHIRDDFYWFDKLMEDTYKENGNSFARFNVLSVWPL